VGDDILYILDLDFWVDDADDDYWDLDWKRDAISLLWANDFMMVFFLLITLY